MRGFFRPLLALMITLGVFSCRNSSLRSEEVAERPKNIIIMIADGWGQNQILATDYYAHGRAGVAPYEAFPVRLAMSTYSAFGGYNPQLAWRHTDYRNHAPTDSAAAATAMSTGTKTYDAAIGVDLDERPLEHLMDVAEDLGKSTGVVSSVQLSHATPAGFVAHSASRKDFEAIAEEMIQRSRADVVMGAGHPLFDNDGRLAATPNHEFIGSDVWRSLTEGTAGGDADGDGLADPWTLIQTRAEFQQLAEGPTPARVVGVPQVLSTLQQARTGVDDDVKDDEPFQTPMNESVPALAEMARAALNVLDNDEDGFVLMIEGGAVDWTGHANQGGRLIEEMTDFNRAVEAVVNWIEAGGGWDETLLVVTGDHETGYLTGPGPTADNWSEPVNRGAGQMPEMQFNSGAHTNQLIPFFARGAGVQAFEAIATGNDPRRGRYLDNTAIGVVGKQLLRGEMETADDPAEATAAGAR